MKSIITFFFAGILSATSLAATVISENQARKDVSGDMGSTQAERCSE